MHLLEDCYPFAINYTCNIGILIYFLNAQDDHMPVSSIFSSEKTLLRCSGGSSNVPQSYSLAHNCASPHL